MRAILPCLALGLSACILAACDSQPAGPSTTVRTEWIYVSTKDSGAAGLEHILRATPGSIATSKVLDSARLVTAPRAGRIAWLLESRTDLYRIMVADLNGGNLKEIARSTSLDNAVSYPVLSPDASRIAYSTAAHRLVLANADGTSPQVLSTSAEYEGIADFSHDGTRIAFYGSDDKLYVAKVDGSSTVAVATGVQSDVEGRSKLEFSPDDSKIVYVGRDDRGQTDIYVVNADGSAAARKLTDDLNGDADPTWSPDGLKIAWTGYPSDIFVINADGTERKDLTPGTAVNDFAPVWSPDGRKILYTSQTAAGSGRSDVGAIKILDLASGAAVILVDDAYRGFWGKY